LKKFKGEDFRVQRSGELLVLFIGLVGFEEIQGRTLGFLSPEEDEELKKIFAGHGRKEWIVEELESKDWIVEEFGGILIPPFCLRWKKIDILSCGGDVQVRMQFSEAMCTPHKYVDSTGLICSLNPKIFWWKYEGVEEMRCCFFFSSLRERERKKERISCQVCGKTNKFQLQLVFVRKLGFGRSIPHTFDAHKSFGTCVGLFVISAPKSCIKWI